MKPQEQKDRFILLRAEGRSYSYISKELKISKATCTDWERTLQAEIAERKEEQLNILYESYFMTKEARVKKLGETLRDIDKCLDVMDFTSTPPERLLDLKLKYTQALKDEYIPTGSFTDIPEEINPAALMDMLKDLLGRVRAGEVSQEQARQESMIIANLLKAYDQRELQGKVEALEELMRERK